MSEKEYEVISPLGLPAKEKKLVVQRLKSLENKTVGEIFNNHFKGKQMFEQYRELFKKRYPGIKIIPFNEFPIVYVGGDPTSQRKIAKDIAAIAKQRGCDALISGNGG